MSDVFDIQEFVAGMKACGLRVITDEDLLHPCDDCSEDHEECPACVNYELKGGC